MCPLIKYHDSIFARYLPVFFNSHLVSIAPDFVNRTPSRHPTPLTISIMNTEEFREFGKAAVDYIADYVDTIRTRPVLPSVQPGYLATLVPEEMPQEGEDWRGIMKDMDSVIMPGVCIFM